MNTRLKEFWEKAKDFFKNMSMKVRVILCVILVAVIAIIAALYIRSTNQPYTTLFNGLSDTDKASIISALEDNGTTDYRVEGNSILVRADQESILMSRMLMLGYPKSGGSYDFYTSNVSTLTTNSERDTYWLIAREQKVAATIRCLEGIRDADVQISLGQDRTYVLDDSSYTESSIGITLTMQDGVTLDNQMAQAIRAWAVTAVPGVSPENVTIIDTIGNNYGLDNISNFSDNSQLKLELQQYHNNQIRTEVMQVLGVIYGKENVRVAVNTVVDVNRRVLESTEYTQPEGSYENGGLIGQENTLWIITADGVDAVGGVPGTTTNADIPLYLEDAIQAAGENAYAAYQNDRDNKINETTEQVEIASYSVTNVSVAVTINEWANMDANVNEEALREHVAVAAGLGGDETTARVSVLLAPFPTEAVEPVAPGIISEDVMPFIIIGAAVLLVMIILLVTLLRVRGKRKKQREAEMAAMEEQLGEYAPIGMMDSVADQVIVGPDGQPIQAPVDTKADIKDVNTEKSMELRKMVRQFVQSNPEVAAQVIKAWVKGVEDGNG